MLTVRFARPDEAPVIADFYRNSSGAENLNMSPDFEEKMAKRCEAKRVFVFSDPENDAGIYAVTYFGIGSYKEKPVVGFGGSLKGVEAREDQRSEYKPLLPYLTALRAAEMVARGMITVDDEGEVTPLISIGAKKENIHMREKFNQMGFRRYHTIHDDDDGKIQIYIDYKMMREGLKAALQFFQKHMFGEHKNIELADDFECLKPEGRERILKAIERLNPSRQAKQKSDLSLWKLAS